MARTSGLLWMGWLSKQFFIHWEHMEMPSNIFKYLQSLFVSSPSWKWPVLNGICFLFLLFFREFCFQLSHFFFPHKGQPCGKSVIFLSRRFHFVWKGIKYTLCKIYHCNYSSLYSSMAWSTFTLSNYHHHPPPNCFILQNWNSAPIK